LSCFLKTSQSCSVRMFSGHAFHVAYLLVVNYSYNANVAMSKSNIREEVLVIVSS